MSIFEKLKTKNVKRSVLKGLAAAFFSLQIVLTSLLAFSDGVSYICTRFGVGQMILVIIFVTVGVADFTCFVVDKMFDLFGNPDITDQRED